MKVTGSIPRNEFLIDAPFYPLLRHFFSKMGGTSGREIQSSYRLYGGVWKILIHQHSALLRGGEGKGREGKGMEGKGLQNSLNSLNGIFFLWLMRSVVDVLSSWMLLVVAYEILLVRHSYT